MREVFEAISVVFSLLCIGFGVWGLAMSKGCVSNPVHEREACEARTCHTPWTKPRYENQIGCVCWERPE